ncbi:MAG: hypothetical protein WAK39_22950 [Pseudolabrys sp.]
MKFAMFARSMKSSIENLRSWSGTHYALNALEYSDPHFARSTAI